MGLVYREQGTSLRETNQLAEAMHAHDMAVQLIPDDANAHHNRAGSLHTLQRYGEAVVALQTCLRLPMRIAGEEPPHAEVRNVLSMFPTLR